MGELQLESGQFIVRRGGGDIRRGAAPEDVPRFVAWAAAYDGAMRTDSFSRQEMPGRLNDIGRALRTWLETADLLGSLIAAAGPIDLTIAVPGNPDAGERALLDVPWELLTDAQGQHLALDDKRPFRVARRVGRAGAPWTPQHRDLFLIFMAAAPAGVSELDHEAEEALILGAVERLPVQFAVEESGALPFLADRIALDAPIEALHVSCHGDVVEGTGVLALEDERGQPALAKAGELRTALGDAMPPLVFVSACRTAENVGAATPFAIGLLQADAANVIGWDGSVYDVDAAAFAEPFYRALALRANACIT